MRSLMQNRCMRIGMAMKHLTKSKKEKQLWFVLGFILVTQIIIMLVQIVLLWR